MKKIALLIWVSSYNPDATVKPAIAPDLQALVKVLEHENLGGFNHVQVLINPDRQSMEEGIEETFRGMEVADLGLFLYSGHCIIDHHVNLYLSTGITRKNGQGGLVKSTAVDANFIQHVLDNSRSLRQVVVIDGYLSGAAESLPYAKDTVDYDQKLGGKGRIVLTALNPAHDLFKPEYCLPSPYLHYLMEGLKTGLADWDKDGHVIVSEWHNYAKKRSFPLNPVTTPELFGEQQDGEIVIARTPPPTPRFLYQREVVYREEGGSISEFEKKALKIIQKGLNLSAEVVNQIESEVFQPYHAYQQKLIQYEQALVSYYIHGHPLSGEQITALRDLQYTLKIQTKDIEYIQKQVKVTMEERQSKLSNYRKALMVALQQQYPIEGKTRNALNNLKQMLDLTDAEVQNLEEDCVTEHLSQWDAHDLSGGISNGSVEPSSPYQPTMLPPSQLIIPSNLSTLGGSRSTGELNSPSSSGKIIVNLGNGGLSPTSDQLGVPVLNFPANPNPNPIARTPFPSQAAHPQLPDFQLGANPPSEVIPISSGDVPAAVSEVEATQSAKMVRKPRSLGLHKKIQAGVIILTLMGGATWISINLPRLFPVSPEKLLDQARDLREQKKYDEAIQKVDESVDYAADNIVKSEAFLQKGMITHEKGDRRAAIAHLTLSIRLNPDNARSYYNRGVVYQTENKLELAIADYTYSIRIDSGYVNAYRQRGLTYRSLGRNREALADLQTAIQLFQQQGKQADSDELLEITRQLNKP